MDLSFYPLDLAAVDQAQAEALCLFVGEDERPLTGLAGLTDWRLSGALSRLLRAGVLKGTQGEAVLTPAKRLPFRKLFIFGIGPLGQSDEELAQRVAECMRKLAAAGVQEAALQLPLRLTAELGIRTLVDAGAAVGPDGEPQAPPRALVFGPDPGALVRALSQAASRGAAATHERRVVKVQGPAKPPPRPPSAPRPAPSTELPRASALPFAPSGAAPGLPRPAPPTELPRASPLPFTPSNAAPVPRPPAAASPAASPPSASAPAAHSGHAPTPEAPSAGAPSGDAPASDASPAPAAHPAASAGPPSATAHGVLPWARPIAPPTVKVAGHSEKREAQPAGGAGTASGASLGPSSSGPSSMGAGSTPAALASGQGGAPAPGSGAATGGAGTGAGEGAATASGPPGAGGSTGAASPAGAGSTSGAAATAAAEAPPGAAASSGAKPRPPKSQRYVPKPAVKNGNGGKKKKR